MLTIDLISCLSTRMFWKHQNKQYGCNANLSVALNLKSIIL